MKNYPLWRTRFIVTVLVASLAPSVYADINDLNVDEAFTYKTQRTINVDIQVTTPTNDMTGLSFYSAGVDGLRLLDTRIIDGSGRYVGKLVLPAYLKSVIVKSRWLDSFKQKTLNISQQKITTTIDHF